MTLTLAMIIRRCGRPACRTHCESACAYAHYNLRTEKTYVYWARFFIRFHNVKHPKEMGGKDAEAKAFAKETLPAVQAHLKVIKDIKPAALAT